MQQIQVEIEAIRDRIQALQQERASLGGENVVLPEDDSPQAIASAYRRHARETAQLAAEVKGIDDAISALTDRLNRKEAELTALQMSSKQQSIEQQVEAGRQRAKVHADRINEIAAELAAEVRSLKLLAILNPVN